MELWGGQEGQVVATVRDGGADESQAVPQAGGAQVGTQEHRAGHGWQHVGELGMGGGRDMDIAGFQLECELIYDTIPNDIVPQRLLHIFGVYAS